MSRAPGSGSRARTRELGYAAGVWEMGNLIRRKAELWEEIAEDQLSPEWRAATKAAAERMRELETYAFGVWEMTVGYPAGVFAEQALHVERMEREHGLYRAPRELPRHEQSDN